MKYFLLLATFLCMNSCLYAQSNRALIVAAGNYPVQSGWEEIHATNDVPLLHSFLTSMGYKNNHIVTLTDEQATYKNIVQALKNLHANTSTGDYVYLHFSCHGQQMADDNGDEEDGLDEALIPIDADFWYTPGKYTGEKHLRDDELGAWIEKIRNKAGSKGQLIAVLDACHSGTANRVNDASDYIRGTAAVFAPEGYVPREGKSPELSLQLKAKPGFAPAVVISACRADEINYEYYDAANQQYYGYLTYALIAVAKENPKALPLPVFMNKLELKMRTLKPNARKKRQSPYMECSDSGISFRMKQ